MGLYLDESVLRVIAKAVNPLLTICLIGAIFWRSQNKEFATGVFIFRALLALIFAFVLGRINAELELWPGLPTDRQPYEFPSGHTCFAASVATSLCVLNRRWLFFTLPFLAAYGALIVLPPLRYHSWLDVFGSWILTPPLALLCHYVQRSNRRRTAL